MKSDVGSVYRPGIWAKASEPAIICAAMAAIDGITIFGIRIPLTV
jgi:hypothetical protein